ncbi:heavy metal translocating P-type ATPase [Magnetofaba australis]|nr:heavy metal translocating P-type ATPase [Magnetofaba australis]
MNASDDGYCYHCGLPIPEGVNLTIQEGPQTRRFCCVGCKTAYQLIQSAGLEEFYKRRDPQQSGGRPDEENLAALAAFDDPIYQKTVVRALPDGKQRVHLLLEGIHCAACVWLNEKVLSGLPGVTSAQVNFSTHRATVTWDPAQTKLSQIIHTVRRIGYNGEPYDPEAVEQSHRKRDRDLLLRMAVAGFGAGNVMLIAVVLYAGFFTGMEAQYKHFFHWLSLVLATPVLFFSGWPFFRGAINGLRLRTLNMDLPIAIGATITYSYSVWITLSGVGEVYFDSVTMFLFFLLTGRFLESGARRKAANATERLLSITPKLASVVRDGDEYQVPVREVAVGEMVRVKPGEQIPLDGTVLSGGGGVDEAMLTGESVPVLKTLGDSVAGGTLNVDGALEIEVTRIGDESAINRIVRMVEAAQAARPPIQTLADRVAGWFVGAILIMASGTLAYWLTVDPAQALENTVALLIITCPCALGLATPAAVVVATGAASRAGILIKGGDVLERLARAQRIVLDKTGTVTLGRPTVQRVVLDADVGEAYLLEIAASLASASEHPIARAIAAYARDQSGENPRRPERSRNHAGLGIQGNWGDEQEARMGRAPFIAEWLGVDALEPPADANPFTWTAVAENGRLLGWFALADAPKPDAGEAVAAFHALGLETTLLSGDRAAVVEQTAAEVGVNHAIGGVLPGEKEGHVAQLQADGVAVAMVGDGVNDAPAMARADVAIAVENAADVSMETADVALLSPQLATAARAIAIAQRTMRIIRQNLTFSLVYNAIAIPLAASGHVLPIVAAVAMPLSSLIVVGNALRLNRIQPLPGEVTH